MREEIKASFSTIKIMCLTIKHISHHRNDCGHFTLGVVCNSHYF